MENAGLLIQLGVLIVTLLAAGVAWRERKRAEAAQVKASEEAERAREESQKAQECFQVFQTEKLEWEWNVYQESVKQEKLREAEARAQRIKTLVDAFEALETEDFQGVARLREAGAAALESEEEFEEAVRALMASDEDPLGEHERILEGLEKLSVLKEYWELQSAGKSVPELFVFLNAKRADAGLQRLKPRARPLPTKQG